MRLRLGIVSETTDRFLNQVKLCLFSVRQNGGALNGLPITLITNSEPLSAADQRFFEENFSPIDFKTGPRLGAIPHASKLNVFYSIDPSTYDVLIYMDCDTVVRRPLDHITDLIERKEADFVCRRGGITDRNRFVDFDALVNRFCGPGRTNKISYDTAEEWPMFNSGVFLGTSEAIQEIRKDSVEFTYRLFNEWQRIDALNSLPPEICRIIESSYSSGYQTKQHVIDAWPIEQGALALACIKSGIKVRYLDEIYNSWGGDESFHILHCFKSLYQFDRNTMYADDPKQWIEEYLESDIPGKQFLAKTILEYKQTFHSDNTRL